MSVNATKKRRARSVHRNQFSRFPRGKVHLTTFVGNIVPMRTALMDFIGHIAHGR